MLVRALAAFVALPGMVAFVVPIVIGTQSHRPVRHLAAAVIVLSLGTPLLLWCKANDKTRFLDFEGSRGTYPVVCTPANYLSWFDPEGAMNESTAVRSMNLRLPVLFIVPNGDYAVLLKAKDTMFAALPHHPLTTLYEPSSSHLDAATASLEAIERWTNEVAATTNAASPETSANGRP